MLNGQAPNIKIITDCNNNIHHEASIDTNGHSQHAEEISDLVCSITKSRWPPNTDIVLQNWTDGIEDAVCKRDIENVVIWERELDQVSGNHLTDGVSIDKTSEEDEWDEVLVKDCWAEVKVGCDEGPGEEEGYQT